VDEARPYDEISDLYDTWISSVADVDYYVSEAAAAGGPIVELGVGTGRVAIPTAARGVSVIGVDSSERMLNICRERARLAGVTERLDLRLGDLRRPPVTERVRLVTCPLRTFSHLETDEDRREALRAVQARLAPAGRFIFDVSTPTPESARRRSGDWDERAPGVSERAEWDWERRRMDLSIRVSAGESIVETRMRFAWLSRDEWRELLESSGFEVSACYGWFDRRPCADSPITIWVARSRPGSPT
jgi:SAM-dependent methyltransferase